MIRGMVLFYLNIKPTHGYEIQRFIQISGMDQWMKIQSGSIYYALTKLEKEKNIKVNREERTGSRVRKIYEITELGKQTLKEEMRNELLQPIFETGSTKYMVYPMISALDSSEVQTLLEKHIKDLQDKKLYWEKWKEVKAGATADRLTNLTFDMTIHSLEDQIIWHKELMDSLDIYMKESVNLINMIEMFEPDSLVEDSDCGAGQNEINTRLAQMERIKESVEKDPKRAVEELNKIMEDMMREANSRSNK